ncbi:hypothetical protein HID58_007739 [Brassica napus]|uniref:peptidylprolyl isomerase n=1 Tax=Brassica napus TaxID=3708 RepID=A0ABQ8EFT5_BRANA|nr:hypothetical protein HID58_007739 [Brassica napus]
MQIGEVARLRCSPDYAYGAGGFPAWGIQPNSVLDFEIEIRDFDHITIVATYVIVHISEGVLVKAQKRQ